jgi:D-sedoheptulose 7-phosphate isomerase
MKHSDYLTQYAAAVHAAMVAAEVTRAQGRPTTAAEGLDLAVEMVRRAQAEGGTVFFCGNGASSAMAGHMALDWLKAGGLKALSFNDPAVLTAVANDTGYENTFSLPISRLGTARDLLVTISSSGNSANVIEAIGSARKAGMAVVTFSGFRPDNRSRALGDLNFFVPCRTYGVAECCHQVLLHAWLDCYLGLKEWETPGA